MKGRAANRLMGARGAVLPVAKRRSPDPIGRSAQTGRGTGINVGVPHTVARGTRSITEIIDVCLANRLSRSAEGVEVVESRVADVGAGAGLREGQTRDEQK